MSNFKKTCRTILLFVLLVVVLSGALMTCYFRGENFYYQDIRERDELAGSLDFLVCGSSHAMSAIIPDILDEGLDVNSYNLSMANASMQGRYEMLSLEMERNPVDTVVLGVSFNALTKTREERGYEAEYYILPKLKPWKRIRYFFEAVRPSEYVSLYYNLINRGLDCFMRILRGTWTSVNQEFEKGYAPYILSEEGDDWIAKDYAAVYNTRTESEELDADSVEYLQKILDLCAENGTQVILICVPLSETYVCECENLDVFREWYEQIAEENGITFYDFNLYKENDTLFSDAVDFREEKHLNREGAEKFSALFVSVYDRARNGEDVSDLFYDSYEERKSHAEYYPEQAAP